VIPKNRILSLVAPTGAGKTAIQTALKLHIAARRPFAGRDLAVGRVLSSCGENPDDKRMRMVATAQQMGLKLRALDAIGVIPDVFSIDARMQEIESEAWRLGGVELVSVDTSAAFFTDGDENDNVAMRRHASSLRALPPFREDPPSSCSITRPRARAARTFCREAAARSSPRSTAT